jgi:hypothetical protein
VKYIDIKTNLLNVDFEDIYFIENFSLIRFQSGLTPIVLWPYILFKHTNYMNKYIKTVKVKFVSQ